MREHPVLGARLLEGLGVSPVDRWILHHHEWWDGSGYPLGLAGEEIPLGSRIILVADAYDAMTSDRCYRAAGTATAAIAELRKRCWTQFDARVVGGARAAPGREPEVAERTGGGLMVLALAVAVGLACSAGCWAAGVAASAACGSAPLAVLRRHRAAGGRLSRPASCRGASATRSRPASGSSPTPC